MITVMVIPTVNYSFAETASQQGTGIESQEPDKATTGSDAVTSEDGTEEEPTDSSQKSEKEVVRNSEASEKSSTEESTEENREQITEEVTEKMKFLYIDNRELVAPETQNIVVSWDSSFDEIEKMQLIYEDPSGEELSLKEANRTDSSVLFTKDFKASEQGNYTIKGVKYFINDEEHYFEFDNVEIDATFVVTAPAGNEENVVEVEVNENGTINKKEISNDIDAALATVSIGAPLKASRSAKSGNVVVVLDPGHGGGDPGAVANGLYEKNLTLKIAQYCKAELEQYSGIEVYMTRDRDSDVGGSTATQELQNRVNVGKKYGADLLISIHINAGGGTGAEVYYPNNNYNSSIGSQGGSAATKIQAELTALGLYNRGTKIRNAVNDKYPNGSAADYYGIIRMSKLAGFPGLIVEHAFIDHASDASFLKSETNLKKLGVADATGIAKYFGLSKGKWVETEDGPKYQLGDGTFARNQQVNTNEGAYYFDSNGNVVKGIYKNVKNGIWYYADEDTGKIKVTAGFVDWDGDRYYVKAGGGVACNEQVNTSSGAYYFGSTCKMIRGIYKNAKNGIWYYADENTGEIKVTAGFVDWNGKKYYITKGGAVDSNGKPVSNRQVNTSEGAYYFDSNGNVVKGIYKNVKNGIWYYADEDTGKIKVTAGFVDWDGDRYYVKAGGGVACNEQVNTSSGAYYFGSTCKMIRGIYKNAKNGIWYYADENTGKIKVTAGFVDWNGKKYYVTKGGAVDLTADNKTLIEGFVNIDSNNLVSYFNKSGKSFPKYYEEKEGISLQEFCQIYIEEARAEDIKVEVAFCQAMKETGWLQFGGDVKISQFNFAGLGATGGVSGATFKDVRTGIRAHIQHLKAYANSELLNNPLVDPRFKYVDRGCAPYVEWLGQKENPEGKGWATAKGYGQSIVSMVRQLLAQ